MRRFRLLLLLLIPFPICAGEMTDAKEAREALPVVLYPRREAALPAEVAGRVIAFRKKIGEACAVGEILIEIDPFLYQAGLEKAEAVAKAAELELETVEKLHKTSSKSLLDVAAARREAGQAQANLKIVRRQVESCTIRAPFAGKVARFWLNEQEWIQQGQKAVSIVDDRVLRAQLLAPARYSRLIRLGTVLQIDLRPGEEPPRAVVTEVAPAIDPASGTYEVYAELDNADGRIPAGSTAKVHPSWIGGD